MTRDQLVDEVIGLADVDRFQNGLLSAIRTGDKLLRAPSVDAQLHRLGERWVLVLDVEEASRHDKPIRVRVKGRWLAYVRVGAGDHRCSPEEEGRFVRDATLERYDQTACPGVRPEHLDQEAIRWLRGLMERGRPEVAPSSPETSRWLASVGLIRPDGELTRAAALLFGTSGVMASVLPRGVVDLRVMHTPFAGGIPKHRWDDRDFCDENLCTALRSLFERLHRLCPQPFALEDQGMIRRARSREEDALREALVNLIAHQDYSDLGRVATILWWRDRIVFGNPGDSYVSVAQMLVGGHSALRNPLIARILRQAMLAEQAGTGLPLILDTWREAGRSPPEIRNDPGRKGFEMAFSWGQSDDEGASEGANDGANDALIDRLHALIAAEPGLRVPALSSRLAVSASTVERAIRDLKSAGRVAFRGASKTGGYHPITTDDAGHNE